MIRFNFELVEKCIGCQIINPDDYWIFNSIVDGEQLYEFVDIPDKKKVERLYCILKKTSLNDLLINSSIVSKIYGAAINPPDTCINFIVGAPDPYDAFVREHNGMQEIFIDLHRLIKYGLDEDRTSKIIKSFITHELIHVANKHMISYNCNSNHDKLLWMVFDEGIAHYLSYKDDVLQLDWNSSEYLEYKETSKKRFEEVITYKAIDTDILEEGCTGKYWSKFASVYGMFIFADIISNNENDINNISDLLERFKSKFRIISKINLTTAST